MAFRVRVEAGPNGSVVTFRPPGGPVRIDVLAAGSEAREYDVEVGGEIHAIEIGDPDGAGAARPAPTMH